MPMVDYQCESCEHRFENFYHSNAPDSQGCPAADCNGTAMRIQSLPGEYRPVNAQRFDPITVWIRNDDPHQFSMPGRANEPVQPGYHALQLTTLAEADQFIKGVNVYEREKGMFMREQQKQYFGDRLKEQRADRDAIIGSNPRMLAFSREIRRRMDAKREKKYSGNMDPKAHFDALSYDQSNRESYCDSATGWKEKRS